MKRYSCQVRRESLVSRDERRAVKRRVFTALRFRRQDDKRSRMTKYENVRNDAVVASVPRWWECEDARV